MKNGIRRIWQDLSDLIIDQNAMGTNITRTVKIEKETLDDIFIELLNDILFYLKSENYLNRVISDIREILKIIHIEPKKAVITVYGTKVLSSIWRCQYSSQENGIMGESAFNQSARIGLMALFISPP